MLDVGAKGNRIANMSQVSQDGWVWRNWVGDSVTSHTE